MPVKESTQWIGRQPQRNPQFAGHRFLEFSSVFFTVLAFLASLGVLFLVFALFNAANADQIPLLAWLVGLAISSVVYLTVAAVIRALVEITVRCHAIEGRLSDLQAEIRDMRKPPVPPRELGERQA